jgi:PAS domain S-box-containing protein
MDEAFYALDEHWRFVFVNGRAAAFWGRSREELIGKSMLELFPHFSGSPSHAAHARAMSSRTLVETEAISTATGAPVSLRIYPDGDGISVYFRDVTDQRRLQKELETRGELLSLAELSAGIGIWVQDLATSTMTATPQFFHLLGIEPIREPIPQDFARSFRHPEDRERVTAQFRATIAAGADSYDSEYRIVRPSGEVRWIFGRGRVTRNAEGVPWRYSGIDIDITDRKKQDEHLRLVTGELQHRTNNLLTVVQGLATQTARNSTSLDGFLPLFNGRLRALANSNQLLAREEWLGAPLRELIETQIGPFADRLRFDVDGPTIQLSSRAAQNLGMAFHELCTNAIKYGALSVPDGRVTVSWSIDGATLAVTWQETGGPPVTPPTRKGFGRVVAEQVLATTLGAAVSTDFAPAGLVWSVRLPASEFSQPIARA